MPLNTFAQRFVPDWNAKRIQKNREENPYIMQEMLKMKHYLKDQEQKFKELKTLMFSSNEILMVNQVSEHLGLTEADEGKKWVDWKIIGILHDFVQDDLPNHLWTILSDEDKNQYLDLKKKIPKPGFYEHKDISKEGVNAGTAFKLGQDSTKPLDKYKEFLGKLVAISKGARKKYEIIQLYKLRKWVHDIVSAKEAHEYEENRLKLYKCLSLAENNENKLEWHVYETEDHQTEPVKFPENASRELIMQELEKIVYYTECKKVLDIENKQTELHQLQGLEDSDADKSKKKRKMVEFCMRLLNRKNQDFVRQHQYRYLKNQNLHSKEALKKLYSIMVEEYEKLNREHWYLSFVYDTNSRHKIIGQENTDFQSRETELTSKAMFCVPYHIPNFTVSTAQTFNTYYYKDQQAQRICGFKYGRYSVYYLKQFLDCWVHKHWQDVVALEFQRIDEQYEAAEAGDIVVEEPQNKEFSEVFTKIQRLVNDMPEKNVFKTLQLSEQKSKLTEIRLKWDETKDLRNKYQSENEIMLLTQDYYSKLKLLIHIKKENEESQTKKVNEESQKRGKTGHPKHVSPQQNLVGNLDQGQLERILQSVLGDLVYQVQTKNEDFKEIKKKTKRKQVIQSDLFEADEALESGDTDRMTKILETLKTRKLQDLDSQKEKNAREKIKALEDALSIQSDTVDSDQVPSKPIRTTYYDPKQPIGIKFKELKHKVRDFKTKYNRKNAPKEIMSAQDKEKLRLDFKEEMKAYLVNRDSYLSEYGNKIDPSDHELLLREPAEIEKFFNTYFSLIKTSDSAKVYKLSVENEIKLDEIETNLTKHDSDKTHAISYKKLKTYHDFLTSIMDKLTADQRNLMKTIESQLQVSAQSKINDETQKTKEYLAELKEIQGDLKKYKLELDSEVLQKMKNNIANLEKEFPTDSIQPVQKATDQVSYAMKTRE